MRSDTGKAQHLAFRLHIHIDHGLLPSHFQSERLYKEYWICAVARASRFGDRLPPKQYLAASHIVVATYSGVQTIPDKQLAAVGAKRSLLMAWHQRLNTDPRHVWLRAAMRSTTENLEG